MAAKRKMTRQEAGKKGVERVAREKRPEFYRQIVRKGEKVVVQRFSKFFSEIGAKRRSKQRKQERDKLK